MGAIRWTDRATDDLTAIYEYVAKDNQLVAHRLVTRIAASPERLRRFPLSGRFVPRMEESGIREIIVVPYRIAYRVLGEDIEILRVFHGARLLRQRDLESA